MKILFLGTGAFGIPALQRLVSAGQAPSLVISQPDRPQGRHGAPAPAPLAAAARALQLPLFQPERINTAESLALLAGEQCGVMIVAAYGQILKRPLLRLPTLGCVNIHGSLLPRHRGASPIQGAILAGDQETGTCTMLMDEGLDTGAVLLSRSTPIGAHESAGELHDRLAQLGAELILPTLEGLEAGTLKPQLQDSQRATHCGLIRKEAGLLDWSVSATDLDRRIRAYTPWPGAWSFTPEGQRFSVLRARPCEGAGVPGTVLRADVDALVIACGTGALLVESVQPAGRRAMPAAAWLRGYALPCGSVLRPQA